LILLSFQYPVGVAEIPFRRGGGEFNFLSFPSLFRLIICRLSGTVHPNFAKVEDAAAARRQGFGCSRLRRSPDNGSSIDPALAGRCDIIGFPGG